MKSLNFKSKISIATGSFDTTSRKASPSLPTLKLFMPKNIFNKMSIFSFINSYIIKHNMWSFGSLAGLSYIVIKIITGIFLAMHYTPHVDLAFNSVEHIMRDVNNGWLIRYLHANGASMFFIVTYIHIFQGLYFGSYMFPRGILWCSGVIIFLLWSTVFIIKYPLNYTN